MRVSKLDILRQEACKGGGPDFMRAVHAAHRELVRMYDSGFPLREIAKRSGYLEASARQTLIRYNRYLVPEPNPGNKGMRFPDRRRTPQYPAVPHG